MGDIAEIRDRRARVAVVTQGIRSFTTTPYVFTTIDRARDYVGAPPNQATYFIVRVDPGADVRSVRRELAARLPDAEVLTSEEFRARSRYFWLFGTGAGAALFASAVLGIIVGTVIVAQTLYSSTKDHLEEFATLRAIGSSRAYIYRVILWQALLSAVIGFSLAAGIAMVLVAATRNSALPIVMTPGLTLGLFALTLAMCTLSAISAITVVTRIDPAMAFTR
jgi:putative ABC transport system permease protein